MIFNILLGFLLFLFLSFGMSWYVSSMIISLPRRVRTEDWEQYNLYPEHITFTASDGLLLVGAFIKGSNGATIVLMHGYGRSKEQMLPQARFLHAAGYSVLMFDFRASGRSEGKYITFGAREQLDFAGSIDYLRKREDVDMSRVGVLGFSMGGAVAIMKSSEIPEIKALVISSAYARFKTVIWSNFQWYLKGIPFFPLGYFTLWVIKFRTGSYYFGISPIKYIEKLQSRPVMFIHGKHDKRIPIEHAIEFQRKAPWLKEYWIVSEGAHDDLYTITKTQYEEKILAFYEEYLLGE